MKGVIIGLAVPAVSLNAQAWINRFDLANRGALAASFLRCGNLHLQKTVLLVDDMDGTRKMVREFLESTGMRRADYHRKKLRNDPEYRQVVRDSQKQWWDEHPDYQRGYTYKYLTVGTRRTFQGD